MDKRVQIIQQYEDFIWLSGTLLDTRSVTSGYHNFHHIRLRVHDYIMVRNPLKFK